MMQTKLCPTKCSSSDVWQHLFRRPSWPASIHLAGRTTVIDQNSKFIILINNTLCFQFIRTATTGRLVVGQKVVT